MVIVAAVDRTERAKEVVKQARELARSFDEPIHIVHVLTGSEFVSLERTNVNELNESLSIDQVHQVAEEIASDAAIDLDVPYETVGLMGNPADEVVEYAEKQKARYIVVAGRKQSPVGKAFFGSVAQSIIMDANRPVVISIRSD